MFSLTFKFIHIYFLANRKPLKFYLLLYAPSVLIVGFDFIYVYAYVQKKLDIHLIQPWTKYR